MGEEQDWKAVVAQSYKRKEGPPVSHSYYLGSFELKQHIKRSMRAICSRSSKNSTVEPESVRTASSQCTSTSVRVLLSSEQQYHSWGVSAAIEARKDASDTPRSS